MRPARLVWRSLAFHARLHAATLGGVLVASLVLTGALALGDSVRASLARAAEQRVGGVQGVLGSGERFFGRALAERLAARVPGLVASAAIQLPAVAALQDGTRRVGDAQLLGIEPQFFTLAPRPFEGAPSAEEAWVGGELARALALEPGMELVLRVPRPSATTRELALVSAEEAIQPLRVRVARILDGDELGLFSLEAGAGPRADLFVARGWLAERLGVAERANRCFLGALPAGGLAALAPALRESWELSDAGLAWRASSSGPELVSDQIFFPEALLGALRGLEPRPLGLLTYFVNGITSGAGSAGERTTPYSTVAALGALDDGPAPDLGGWRDALGSELAGDEMVLNDWTAGDLAVMPGERLTLRYFALGPGRALEERTHEFRLRSILPTAGLGADPTLSPEFPGIGDAENCRDWEPGFPIDLARLRDEDEAYWQAHRGAPKAFVALDTARALFGNRFGTLTAVRVTAGQEADVLASLRAVDPGALGLPLRAVSARSQGTSDFGGLFLGLSFFLIASALLLTALFFAFALERRASELGVLRVTGLPAREVVELQLAEALLICTLGAGLGIPLGLVYTKLLLSFLEHAWSGAVGRTELLFRAEPLTLVLSSSLALVLALGAVALVLRRARRARPLALLWGELGGDSPGVARARARGALLAVGVVLALGALAGALLTSGATSAGLGFAAGLAALGAGLAGLGVLLARPSRPRSMVSLGWTNAARRQGRSLTTAALTASAVFLLVVAGASRQGPTPPDAGALSGTGGFSFLGRTSLPVLHDLASPAGREFYALSEEELAGVTIVPMRVLAGDEASCLNLDAPQNPRLLGVRPQSLAGRFRFADVLQARADPWSALEMPQEDGCTPVVVDAVSLQWTLHRSLGDVLELTDGRGRPFRARVVATLADSILQGDVLLDERQFEALFPDEVGHRAFLFDVPGERAQALGARLSRVLADEGLTLVPAHERLDLLHGVQNTYLSIFQALGGLGLVLGSVGLLALVLRSAAERRAELGLLRALGFSRLELRLLFLGEQGGLVWAGLGIGALAGTCVVVPRLDADSVQALQALGWMLGLVGLSGTLWVWCGAFPALRGSAFEALESE